MVSPPVRSIIRSLKRVDYLFAQEDKSCFTSHFERLTFIRNGGKYENGDIAPSKSIPITFKCCVYFLL